MVTCGGHIFPFWGLCFTFWMFKIIVTTSSNKMMIQYEFIQCNDGEMSTTATQPQLLRVLPREFPPSMNVTSVSDLTCAIKAKQRQALVYTYEDGTCTLFGVRQGDDCKVVIYVPGEVPFPILVEEVAQGAQGKDIYATPQYGSNVKARAVDSKNTTMYISAVGNLTAWWLVDLGETRTIHKVQILPRQDLKVYRMHDTAVRIGTTLKTDGDFSTYTLMTYYEGPYSIDQETLIYSYKDGFTGRYLSIQHMIDNYDDLLQLTEVAVFAAKH